MDKIPKVVEALSLLNETHDLILRARDLGLKGAGITTEQADVLWAIDVEEKFSEGKGHATPSRLARFCMRQPHTMSGMLTRMESIGLVKRKRGADKKRKNLVWIELTPKGKEALKTAAKQTVADEIFNSIGSGERIELVRLLEKLQKKALHKVKDLQPLPFETPSPKE